MSNYQLASEQNFVRCSRLTEDGSDQRIPRKRGRRREALIGQLLYARPWAFGVLSLTPHGYTLRQIQLDRLLQMRILSLRVASELNSAL